MITPPNTATHTRMFPITYSSLSDGTRRLVKILDFVFWNLLYILHAAAQTISIDAPGWERRSRRTLIHQCDLAIFGNVEVEAAFKNTLRRTSDSSLSISSPKRYMERHRSALVPVRLNLRNGVTSESNTLCDNAASDKVEPTLGDGCLIQMPVSPSFWPLGFRTPAIAINRI